jgi:hypothetical protein
LLGFSLNWLALGAAGQPQNAGSSTSPASQPAPSNVPVIDEDLHLRAVHASTWRQDGADVVLLNGPVAIDLENAHLSADNAVVWLSPEPKAILPQQKVEIALLGNAVLSQQGQITRSGATLFVDGVVRGAIQLRANQRVTQNQSDSDLYRQARLMRPALLSQPQAGEDAQWLLHRPWMLPSPPAPSTRPATRPVPSFPIHPSADQSVNATSFDGTMAFVLTGHVTLLQNREGDESFQMQADRAVLFTSLHRFTEAQNGPHKEIDDLITAVYLEGDVRIVHVPPAKRGGEERLLADRVYYDFQTDRAILTQAVLHTIDAQGQQPIILRAKVMRQLSEGEYSTDHAQVTSSSFQNPSYSIRADKLYIRQVETGDPRYGTYTNYFGNDATFTAYDVPYFYTPWIAGTMTNRGALLRAIDVREDSRFGEAVLTQWGLLESLGQVPPANRGDDITYGVDYFSSRGPAVELNAKYADGFITPETKSPFDFEGSLHAIYINDHGTDDLGNDRDTVTPPTINRGRFEYNHQQFLPDNWQIQLSTAWFSDPTFNEEYYQDDFDTDSPRQTTFYAKQQHDTQALTFLASIQPNRFVTNADSYQENFEVEQLPELAYRRIGDSLFDDHATLFSQNSFDTLRFHQSAATAADLGFDPAYGGPGLPYIGTTGLTDHPVYRGDFREEFDLPVGVGEFRAVPYVFGRYTGYSASPVDQGQNRYFAGTGLRLTTDFWRTDDSVESELFDLHRLRHVIEPQLNLFTSAESLNRDKLYQFDQDTDEITDISAVQLALNQRWQTKRGGPDRWRSVDVFTLNVQGNFFANKPKDQLMNPTDFRGLFFPSEPEASIPRDSINSDFTWRMSDTTAVLGDVEYNTDAHTLATGSIGIAVRRDTRFSYFLGQRYIHDLNSNITTFAVNYEITSKYTLSYRQSFDFGVRQSVGSNLTLIRQLDRFLLEFELHYDVVTKDSGFGIGLVPQDLVQGAADTSNLKSVFSQ